MSSVHAQRASETTAPRFYALNTAKAYFTLTKPRIAVLLLFTAYAAMVVAANGLPSIRETLFGLLGHGCSAGGAAAINMWYDRDIDAVMSRTAKRPLPAGVLRPAQALSFGIALEVVSVLLLGLTINWLVAALSGAGYVYYVRCAPHRNAPQHRGVLTACDKCQRVVCAVLPRLSSVVV